MYCLECGAQIPDNSKFCSHCGKKQHEGEHSLKEKTVDKIIKTEMVRQVAEEHKKSLDYGFFKKIIGYYFAWVVLHLGILLIGSDGVFDGANMGVKKFWPFNDSYYRNQGIYDITEFLVYAFFPLAILAIWSMIRTQNQGKELEDEE